MILYTGGRFQILQHARRRQTQCSSGRRIGTCAMDAFDGARLQVRVGSIIIDLVESNISRFPSSPQPPLAWCWESKHYLSVALSLACQLSVRSAR